MKVPSVKGFHDVLPGESGRWTELEGRARGVFAQYNFHEIRVPIVERAELFRRSIGETTDIVEKEMYGFTDRDGSALTLRPEGTASVVRAYVEHALHAQEPVSKLYYLARCSGASARRKAACASSRRSAPSCSAATIPPRTRRSCC